MEEEISLFKLYHNEARKMKTFREEEDLKEFVKERGYSWADVTVLKLTAYGVDNAIIEIEGLEEFEEGKRYVSWGELVLREGPTFVYSVDASTPSRVYRKVNDALKDFIQELRRIHEEGYEENTRYSIYDVYSPSELL
jgi:hypothetical protein